MTISDLPTKKIIILSFIKSIPGITHSDLTKLVLETCYMNYFELATLLEELKASKLIAEGERKWEAGKTTTHDRILRLDTTPAGEEALKRLDNLLPDNIRLFINLSASQASSEITKSTETIATYKPDFHGGFIVNLCLTEGKRTLVNLEIIVPTKEQAELICLNWRNNTTETYKRLLKVIHLED